VARLVTFAESSGIEVRRAHSTFGFQRPAPSCRVCSLEALLEDRDDVDRFVDTSWCCASCSRAISRFTMLCRHDHAAVSWYGSSRCGLPSASGWMAGWTTKTWRRPSAVSRLLFQFPGVLLDEEIKQTAAGPFRLSSVPGRPAPGCAVGLPGTIPAKPCWSSRTTGK